MKADVQVSTTPDQVVPVVVSAVIACPSCRMEIPSSQARLGDFACPGCHKMLWVMRDNGRFFALDAQLVPDELRAWLQSVFIDLHVERIEDLDGLAADSLETLSLIMALEDAFDVRVSKPGTEDIRTIADALRYVERQLRAQHAEK